MKLQIAVLASLVGVSTLALAAGPESSQDDAKLEEIGSGSGAIPLAGRARPSPIPSPTPELFRPASQGAITGVRLIRVIPMSGNNPFNQREPIRNRDGLILSDQTPLPGQSGSPGSPAAPSSCIGQMVVFTESPTAPAGIGFAGLNINPNTGACGLVSGGSGGHALFFQSPPDAGPPTRYSYSVDVLEGIWTQIDPAPPVGGNIGVPGVQQTVTIRATTGLTARVQFTVSGSAPLNYQVRLDSLTFL